MKKIREEVVYEEETKWGFLQAEVVNNRLTRVILRQGSSANPIGMACLPTAFHDYQLLTGISGFLDRLPFKP